jgi:para-nitrobenzyl esterase|tara:strand:- start:204 stop:2024 length:1821 start_codon:yes stop_codon:yes gene_type:complete
MRIVAYILLAIVLVVFGIGIGGYLYLRPEEAQARLPSPSSVRSVESGDVIGRQGGYETHAWLGIPYAAAPAGNLRWKAPRPPESWQGTYEALDVGRICPQYGQGGALSGDEDCLFLNIWTKIVGPDRVPSGSDRLPVMFWIHGGGNSIGDGGTIIYDGSFMAAEHDVVVVTMNYRLGPFGWFTHPALRAESDSASDQSGNYGTLDIIRALQWVQTNISSFGGDPGNVTIYGESAGGFNVLTMMASPLAKNLFHRAIVQSGGLNIRPVSEAENYIDDQVKGHRFSSKEIVNNLLVNDATVADRDTGKARQESMSTSEIAAYLYAKSPTEIFAAYTGSGSFSMLGNPTLFGDGHVLPRDTPNDVIFGDTGNYNSVPVILGTNRDEWKLFQVMSDDLIDKLLGLPVGIKDPAAYERNNRYRTDRWKATAVDELASSMRQAQGASVYAYRFDADDWRNLGFIDLQELLGAAHAMEIPYVFGNFPNPMRILYPGSTVEARDLLSTSIMSYWAEFAYEGNPGSGRFGEQVEWTAWQNGDRDVLRLLVLDSEMDAGIRMSPYWLTMADIKTRFLKDRSFATQQEYCAAYKFIFPGKDFVQSEYESLGTSGCAD